MIAIIRNSLNIKVSSNVSPVGVLALASNARTPTLLMIEASNDRVVLTIEREAKKNPARRQGSNVSAVSFSPFLGLPFVHIISQSANVLLGF